MEKNTAATTTPETTAAAAPVTTTATVAGAEVIVVKSKIEALRALAKKHGYSIDTQKADTASAAPMHILSKVEVDDDGNQKEVEIGRRTSTNGIERLLNETLNGKPEKAPKAPRVSTGVVKAAVEATAKAAGVEKLSEFGEKVATALFRVTGGKAELIGEAFTFKKSDFTLAEGIEVGVAASLGFDAINGLLAAAKRLKLDFQLNGTAPGRMSIVFKISTRPVEPVGKKKASSGDETPADGQDDNQVDDDQGDNQDDAAE